MAQPDRDKFMEVMVKEIEDHTRRGHWWIATRAEMKAKSYTQRPIMGLRSCKRKRKITMYKAHLCCHGGRIIKGLHCDNIFSPVVS